MHTGEPDHPVEGGKPIQVSRVPGIRGVDHIGLVVPDLAAALQFFTEIIGAALLYRHGPYSDTRSDRMWNSYRIDPQSVIDGIAMVQLANFKIELFEISTLDQRRLVPRMSDHGTSEFAFYVEDIDMAIAHLRKHGIDVWGEKTALKGPEAGFDAYYVYFAAPWGVPMELISYPHGRVCDDSIVVVPSAS